MKGMVFTEFFELVETAFGDDVLDEIIDESNIDSGGVYTSVGNYDYQELVALVVALSDKVDVAVPDLIETYGKHLFGRFFTLYPSFFDNVSSTFDFLERIDDHIHVEVRKLHPDAELPKFDIESHGNRMTMNYSSSRPFGYFAKGLITGCIDHFGEQITIDSAKISDDMTQAIFELSKK